MTEWFREWIAKVAKDFVTCFITKDRWKYIVKGLGNTLQIALAAVLLGILIGTIVAIIRSTHDKTHETMRPGPGRTLLNIADWLCKVYLTRGDYANAYTWGKKFVDEQYGAEYSLCPVYTDNFTLAGENGPESVFEIQYMADPTSDYGEGFGFTRGTFSTILTRPRMSSLGGNKGWGFDHPTIDLYNEFEAGDSRREAAIGVPDAASQQEVEVMYLNTPYYNNKVSYSEGGTFPALDHACLLYTSPSPRDA